MLFRSGTATEFNEYLIKVTSSDGFVNIRKTPKFVNDDIVGKIENSNIKYTIVDEVIVNNTMFVKLMCGAGYVALNCCTNC